MTKLGRSRSSGRGGSYLEKAFDALLRSPLSLSRFTIHLLLCIAALLVGFRLSREALLVVGSLNPSNGSFFFKTVKDHRRNLESSQEVALGFPYVQDDRGVFTPPVSKDLTTTTQLKSSRVHVGRHEILIRPWPHPDPVQSVVAHHLLGRVQEEQRHIYGLKERKQLLLVTPTYVRTFQALHLNSLIHTLQLIPGPLIWIVVEAGGITNETAALLAKSQLSYHHLCIKKAMPVGWREREQMETLLRLEGLRFLGQQKLDGVVVFADDSNTYSLDFFDEAQHVNWIGFFSVGLLSPSGLLEPGGKVGFGNDQSKITKKSNSKGLPFQSLICNSSGHAVGWYSPFQDEDEQGWASHNLKWAGFTLNARIFWNDYEKPSYIRSWTEVLALNQALLETPLALVKNWSVIEPLGSCGQDILLWWLRVEARADSKFPSSWLISHPLEVVVQAKRTPWPDPSPPPPPGASPPPPPPSVLPSVTATRQRAKRKSKGTKKQVVHHGKQELGKMVADQV